MFEAWKLRPIITIVIWNDEMLFSEAQMYGLVPKGGVEYPCTNFCREDVEEEATLGIRRSNGGGNLRRHS